MTVQLEIDPAVIAELVVANHILFHRGVVDGFGHVSVRCEKQPDKFLIGRSMAPALVTPGDIQMLDLSGAAQGGDSRVSYLERFIHSEIYRARPEVMSVVHSHSPAVVPFGVVAETPLRPVFHMSGFLGAGAPVYEIRATAGEDSDMLIRDARLGAALAGALGSHAAVLMRGHGSTVVGGSLRQAVYRAVYTEVNARLQADALRLGRVNYLTPGEAVNAARTNDAQIGRAWELWKLEAAATKLG